MGLMPYILAVIYLAIGTIFAMRIKFYEANENQIVIVKVVTMLIWPVFLGFVLWLAIAGKPINRNMGNKKGDK